MPNPSPIQDDTGKVSIRGIFVNAASWTVLGFGTSQFIRLVGNLILTRLLLPEHFGLMALLNVFVQGLEMFSDTGVSSSIVQHPDAEDSKFLNTAWTLQILRGFALWIVAVILAWPMAALYSEPAIRILLPILALEVVIAGFNSTSLYTSSRNLRVKRLVMMEVLDYSIGLIVIIEIALVHASVWAFIIGGIAGAMAKALLSHWMLARRRHRFQLDRSALAELTKFGRWIFLSTAFGFLATRGDRLIVGKFVPLAKLGIYSIAYWLATFVPNALQAVSSRLLFPLYSRLAEIHFEELRSRITRIRAVILLVSVPPLCALIVGGDLVVQLLYEPEWHAAGPMLQLLSIGALASAVTLTLSPLLLALGDSFHFMIVLILKFLLMALCMAGGGLIGRSLNVSTEIGGGALVGMICGLVVSSYLTYIPLVCELRKKRLWMWRIDLLTLAAATALIATGFALRIMIF